MAFRLLCNTWAQLKACRESQAFQYTPSASGIPPQDPKHKQSSLGRHDLYESLHASENREKTWA